MGRETVLQLLRVAVSEGLTPSAALSVSLHGEILMREFIGRSAVHPVPAPLEPGTLFDMASLTKTMATAMITLRFIEEGLLTLPDPLALYLPVPADKQGITLFHLLTHSSGLPPHIPLWTESDDPAGAIGQILASPLGCVPGMQVAYSCMGYILLGRILELVGGDSLDRLTGKWVFGPLGMKDTGYLPVAPLSAFRRAANEQDRSARNATTEQPLPPLLSAAEQDPPPRHAATEQDPATGNWLCGVVHDENARFLGGVSGNAGLFSTLDDCTRFAGMLSNGGRIDGQPFLSPAMFRTAIRNATPGLEESRGLGFSLYDGRPLSCGDLFSVGSFGHTGFTGTSLWMDAQTGLSVVLLTNSVHYGRERDAFFRFRRLLHNAIAAAFPVHQAMVGQGENHA